jgi:nitrate reductase gamma subunit
MMPWAKESVRENLFSYAMGIAYHIGIFSAFVLFLWHFGILYPKFLRFPFFGLVLGVIPFFGLVLGVIGGVSLFIKRLVNPTLRGISCADDYISNIFTTAFLALSVPVHFFYPFHLPLVCPIWLFSAIVLFVYIPFSKMRHCLFFFSTRYHLGAFFGRRGCMPPSR